ncbi:MAG: AmmeMemoRadiSam system protein B [Candidatus Anstonellales archaeon]
MREPHVAGYFYPEVKEDLEAMLASFESSVLKEKQGKAEIIIAPHAGYVYSGKTAMAAHIALRQGPYVVVGPNHSGYGLDVALSTMDWSLPNGTAFYNEEAGEKLLSFCKILKKDELAHRNEHSLEVQHPIRIHLQGNSKAINICLLNQSPMVAKELAEALTKLGLPVVFSTDFTHYLPERTAKEIDQRAIDCILKKDSVGFIKGLREGWSMCGYGGILTFIEMCKLSGYTPELISYTTSAEASGDKSAVVGYAAIGGFIG